MFNSAVSLNGRGSWTRTNVEETPPDLQSGAIAARRFPDINMQYSWFRTLHNGRIVEGENLSPLGAQVRQPHIIILHGRVFAIAPMVHLTGFEPARPF